METIKKTRSESSCGICDECQAQDFANCSWRVEREGVMDLPPRSEGQLADAQRAIQELERTNLWLETVCAILVERLHNKDPFGAPIVYDGEIESPDTSRLVETRADGVDGWVLTTRMPADDGPEGE